jgi:membrane protease YdiL (CAAX protease family)
MKKSIIDRVIKMKDLSEKDFFKFERKKLDFPFYNDNPNLSIPRWILLAISVIIPFILIFTPHSIGGRFENLLYFILPFLFFGIVANWKYDLICKKFQKNDFKLIPILIILEFIFSIAVGFIMMHIFNMHIQSNPALTELNSLFFWVLFPFQIFGEELLKIIPFLIFLTIFYKVTENRKISIVISTIIVLIIFGLIHLPAYDNLISVLLIQGLGSIFTMFAYLKTKNIFVSFLTHLIYDTITFLPVLLILL